MKSETVSAIHDFSLKARELMLKEVDEQLEGIYGFLPNGTFELADKYPALNELEEARETRKRLGQFIADENAAGISPKDARNKLSLEIAFTRLNRMVALKMMENRGLIRQSVGKGADSNGFKRWVVKNEAELEKYEAGDLPQNAIGEGPRQEAYRHYLLWLCAELSKEIKVLFDPNNLPSRIFPRPRALNQLSELMNADSLKEAWEPGGEETVGWVYQFFNENEKKEVFDRLYKKKQKIKKEDIPAATELFTPNWIVKWLIQNSLGRHWIQMHSDSRLAETLDYLVPLAGEIPSVSLKKVADIKMLDPACGTMHFGLIAFDIFHEMYREELKNSGNPGWPDTPSVNDETEIPAAIIANNIHGIDIDLRAVQLSALALYVKAKSTNKDTVITKSNLACADVIKFDREKLEKFIEELDLTDSVYSRILGGVWEELENLSLAGSLLRFEVKLASLIEEEKIKFNMEKQISLPGFAEEQFETAAGKEEFWEIIGTQIRQALDHYLKMEIEKGSVESLFTGETQKGFQVLDILSRRYDVVATNPPYLALRSMDKDLSDFLKAQYPKSKMDMYAAFIERCSELLKTNGRLAMITQQSFMFINAYEKMRKNIIDTCAIEGMCHVGPRAFEAISGEKVNTTFFTLRRERNKEYLSDAIGTYFRLSKELNALAKKERFEQELSNINSGKDSLIFYCCQAEFNSIPGYPWLYWITPNLRNLFGSYPKLGDIAKIRQGLATADNFRFIRFWWEVDQKGVGFDCKSENECNSRVEKWYPFMKGGTYLKWYGNQEFIINYGKNGYELKAWADKLYGNSGWSRSITSPEFYFRKGITYTAISSKGFASRYMPEGFPFDHAGNCVFMEDENSIFSILGILNSTFSASILRMLNPTVNVYTSDLNRLPIITNWSDSLRRLVSHATEIATNNCRTNETTFNFIAPSNWTTGVNDILEANINLKMIEEKIDEEVYKLYNLCAEDREVIKSELNEVERVKNDAEPKNQELKTRIKHDLSLQWISYAVGIAFGRFQPGVGKSLGHGNFSNKINEILLTSANADGIMVMDSGHIDDLPARSYEILTAIVSEAEASQVVQSATGKNGPAIDLLRQYLGRTYFKEHLKLYRKRPIYWLLQSPRKKYGIWVFHERMNPDTLYRIRDKYVETKINHLESQLSGLRSDRDGADGGERRKIDKLINEFTDVLDDVQEFEKLLKRISEERGYTPHIDDGVLLNMAPLWELIPSWQKEPKKAWEALERGDYDWAHQSMDHWPERVKEKCKANKSFAIAHGLDH